MALTDEALQDMRTVVSDRRLMNRYRYPYVWQWYININVYAGNQWVRWDPGLLRVQIEPQDPDKPHVTENKIQPTVRQAVGKLMRSKLKQVSPPDAHSEAAVDKARVRTRLLEHLYRETNTESYLKSLVTWAALTGNGFARYMWDEDAGPKGKRGSPQGEVSVSVVSPFSIIVPPNCLSIEECPWIMEVTTRPVAWVKEHYGVDVDSDASPNAFDQFDARVLDFTSAGAFVRTSADTDGMGPDGKPVSGGACNYAMYWERPTAAYRNGRLIIVAGNKVVWPTTDEEAKEGITVHSPTGDLPYAQLRWFDSGFRFWDMGLVELLVPLQKERNLLCSMILDALKSTVRAGYMAPLGSVKKDEWTTDSGSINYYTPVGGFKPEPMGAQRAIAPEFFARLNQIDMDMGDIAGMHYRPAPGVRAAAAFALQQETDNTLGEPVSDNVRAFLVRDGQLKLRLTAAHYGRGRSIRTIGDAEQWEVMEYDRDKAGDCDAVEVQDGGQLASDKVQRLEQVLKLLGAKDAKGEPIIDALEARRLLDLENSYNIDSQVRADVNRARYENELLLTQDVAVNRWDNDDVHLREHYTRMKRIDFDQLPVDVRNRMILHTQAHEQQKASKQAPAMGPAPGGPPPMAAPGQPGVPGLPNEAAQMAQQALPGQSGPVVQGLQSGLSNVNNLVSQANA